MTDKGLTTFTPIKSTSINTHTYIANNINKRGLFFKFISCLTTLAPIESNILTVSANNYSMFVVLVWELHTLVKSLDQVTSFYVKQQLKLRHGKIIRECLAEIAENSNNSGRRGILEHV